MSRRRPGPHCDRRSRPPASAHARPPRPRRRGGWGRWVRRRARRPRARRCRAVPAPRVRRRSSIRWGAWSMPSTLRPAAQTRSGGRARGSGPCWPGQSTPSLGWRSAACPSGARRGRASGRHRAVAEELEHRGAEWDEGPSADARRERATAATVTISLLDQVQRGAGHGSRRGPGWWEWPRRCRWRRWAGAGRPPATVRRWNLHPTVRHAGLPHGLVGGGRATGAAPSISQRSALAHRERRARAAIRLRGMWTSIQWGSAVLGALLADE